METTFRPLQTHTASILTIALMLFSYSNLTLNIFSSNLYKIRVRSYVHKLPPQSAAACRWRGLAEKNGNEFKRAYLFKKKEGARRLPFFRFASGFGPYRVIVCQPTKIWPDRSPSPESAWGFEGQPAGYQESVFIHFESVGYTLVSWSGCFYWY